MKKRLEDSDRKLKILEKQKIAVDKQLSDANIELEALKVACDEHVEKEGILQKDLDKATEGSAILDSDILSNYP